MEVITSHIVPQTLESRVKVPEGRILGFFTSPMSDDVTLKVSVLHSTDAVHVERNFYIITEPQFMKSTDSIGKFYGSFDMSSNGQLRTVHVFEQLYKQ